MSYSNKTTAIDTVLFYSLLFSVVLGCFAILGYLGDSKERIEMAKVNAGYYSCETKGKQ